MKEVARKSWRVKCAHCGVEFDLRTAAWCDHQPLKSKLCPKGHCICHMMGNHEAFRPATQDEYLHGFLFMLRKEYGGR